MPPERLPSLEEKLVISSFISPQDELVKVYVGLSSPLFSEFKSVNRGFSVFDGDTTFLGNTPFVSGADVLIKSGNTEVKLEYDPNGEYYFFRPSSRTLRISPNQKYELQVNFQGKTATSETIVPDMPIINFEVEVDTAFLEATDNQFQSEFYSIASNIKFTTAVGGHYRFRGYVEGRSSLVRFTSPEKIETVVFDDSRPIFFADEGFVDATSQTEVETYKITGRTIMGGGASSINGQIIRPNERPILYSVYNEVMRVTEPYYLYYESLRNFNDDNPFVEPTPVYTNINGGLGIFASSNRIGKRTNFN